MRLLHVRARAAVLGAVAALSIPLAVAPGLAQEPMDAATIERIKDEALNRSQVMDLMSWLTDVYGPRLTWSPNVRKAATWAMGEMTQWGLANVHFEDWDSPPGLGWQNDRFWMNVVAPTTFIVQAVPRAWSPGTRGTITGPAVRLEAECLDEAKAKYAGKLTHAFVLAADPVDRPVNDFAPRAMRLADSTLERMAAATPDAGGRAGRGGRGGRGGAGAFAGCSGFSLTDVTVLQWLAAQDAGAVLLGDTRHSGGDVGTDNGSPRAADAPQVPAVHVAQESYGRIARMLAKHVPVVIALNMQNTFYPASKSSFNIIGEIPGTDPALKDDVVMIGAHFDSWHAGTGATDNGAGSGVMLEAMRILKALDLKPRRTIRIALWTGEEQGLLGSRAYVAKHFGTADSAGFHPTAEQEKVAAYFNVDNGSGRIRGVYLQGIEAVRPIFDAWMEPFKAMGMQTLTIANTGGTDHLSYIAAGLPGFQFIQDPLDYGNVTHHTNQDVYERLQPGDLKFNAAVVAAFAWQAAQRDGKLPRPAMPAGGRGAIP